ncbi:DUF4097 family beta strand repeat-containing protein [Kitasatospora sp. NPDC053057]|uniref:DUF4097 family beta strand repeat-containing protein n=1 Tax=Kitasatospora sp. NPDC053057 TaxID=3364062 RepID=UPI0037C76260
MPIFETPTAISASLEFVVADVEITAGQRSDTVVAVRPSNDSEASAKAAEQTTVEYANGKLLIRGPKQRRGLFGWSNRNAQEEKDSAVHVSIELPEGSDVRGEIALGYLSSWGRLGDFSLKSACGNVDLEETAALRVEAALGDVTVNRVVGNADITATHGDLKIDTIQGSATIKNLSGTTDLGDVAGDLRLNAMNGNVSIGRTRGSVEVRNTNGDIRVSEVTRGKVALETTRGSVGVGVRAGTSAHLDARTLIGSLNNALGEANAPTNSDGAIELRARTIYGDVDIRRV